MNANTILAANIRRLRRARGWNQTQLAAESGVPQTSISDIETGRKAPKFSDVADIATALAVGLDTLRREHTPDWQAEAIGCFQLEGRAAAMALLDVAVRFLKSEP